MKKSTTAFGAGLFSILVSGALTGSALAERRPGVDFKAAFPGGAACLQVFSAGALRNTCLVSHQVVATQPNLPAGPHQTSIHLFGSALSGCRSMTTDLRGDGVDIGPFIAAVGAAPSWQTVNTGIRNSPLGLAPIVFRCTLEPGGIIGTHIAQ